MSYISIDQSMRTHQQEKTSDDELFPKLCLKDVTDADGCFYEVMSNPLASGAISCTTLFLEFF